MNEVQPLITVITVTYNSAKYVRDAIESVLAQTYVNIEYIIADDCSTDKTWDIINEYSDPRIIAVRNEENLGEYSNRNKAIEMATGKYLIFIDGDDYIYPHGINYYVSMIEVFPEAAFAVQENYTNNIIYPILLNPYDTIQNFYFGKNALLCSSFSSNFFRTDFLKKENGLSLQYKTGDEEIRLRLACKYPVLFIQGWVTWPRETPGQASAKLKEGLGLFELFKMSFDLLARGYFSNTQQQQKIIVALKNRVSRFALKCFLKLEWKKGSKAKEVLDTSYIELFKNLFKKQKVSDFLENYTPAYPLTNSNDRSPK
jgi:glycosyltransferase involved in cell wall biosynthesis